jgi:hypothetical protein
MKKNAHNNARENALHLRNALQFLRLLLSVAAASPEAASPEAASSEAASAGEAGPE